MTGEVGAWRWRGDLNGTGSGVLLSCGNPESDEAGYVAIERSTAASATGTVGSHSSSSVPGTAAHRLRIAGTLRLTIDDHGTHRYELEYDL